jgi:hypothetical protein
VPCRRRQCAFFGQSEKRHSEIQHVARSLAHLAEIELSLVLVRNTVDLDDGRVGTLVALAALEALDTALLVKTAHCRRRVGFSKDEGNDNLPKQKVDEARTKSKPGRTTLVLSLAGSDTLRSCVNLQISRVNALLFPLLFP